MPYLGQVELRPEVEVFLVYGRIAVEIGFRPDALGKHVLRQVQYLKPVQRQGSDARRVGIHYGLEYVIVLYVHDVGLFVIDDSVIAVHVHVGSAGLREEVGILVIYYIVLVDIGRYDAVRPELAHYPVHHGLYRVELVQVFPRDQAVAVGVPFRHGKKPFQHRAFALGDNAVIIPVETVPYVPLKELGGHYLGQEPGVLFVHLAVVVEVEVQSRAA